MATSVVINCDFCSANEKSGNETGWHYLNVKPRGSTINRENKSFEKDICPGCMKALETWIDKRRGILV